MKSRIEVNDLGEFYIIIPEDVMSNANLDEGDVLLWDDDDPEIIILTVD